MLNGLVKNLTYNGKAMTPAPTSPTQEQRVSTASTPIPQTVAPLQSARERGDQPADELVQSILRTEGASGYNHIIDLMHKLSQSPDLLTITSSNLASQLRTYPESLLHYFSPAEAPDWVSAEKLQLASDVWHENKLAIIGILYAGSLPFCYLSHKGIPALYATDKLKNEDYIFQRIYETGLFLEAVLSEGGFKLVQDIPAVPETGSPAQPSEEDSPPPGNRYLSGPGYMTSKKIRFLHATMRYMLTQNPQEGAPGWNQQAYGTPINQEDLAYTLLTFAYVIPIGLDHWGCFLTPAQCEAFLHLWRVVGHTIGIEAGLLPETWAEAKDLFETIRSKQDEDIDTEVTIPFDSSEVASREALLTEELDQGKELTNTLIGFLQKYLPTTLGIRRSLPPLLILQQLGSEQADRIFKPEHQIAIKSWPSRIILHGGLRVLHLCYAVRNFFFRRIPVLRTSMSNIFSEVGNALIDSWRDDYQRRPFYIPTNLKSWQRRPGASQPGFQDDLQEWRCTLFNVTGGGVACLVAAIILLALGVSASAAWVLDSLVETASHIWSFSCYLGIGVLFTGGILTLAYNLPAKMRKPTGPDQPLPNSKLADLAWASLFFLFGLVLVFEKMLPETPSLKTLLWTITPFAGLSVLTFAGGLWLLLGRLGKVIKNRPTPNPDIASAS